MTTKIRLLAWLHILFAGVCLAIGFAVCIGLLLSDHIQAPKTLAFVGPIFVGLAVLYLVPGFIGGVGLLLLKPWGRFLIIALSLLMLPLLPVGTLFGAFGLWVLFDVENARSFGGGTAQAPPPVFPKITPSSGTAGLLLAIAGVGAGFIVVIGAGFKISGDHAPDEIANAFYPALGVLAFVLGYAALALFRRAPRASVAHAPIDAARRKGGAALDVRSDYERDKSKTVTCEHLRGVERTMRDSGIRMRPEGGPRVSADCRINVDDFKQRYEDLVSVRYAEVEQKERSHLDPPNAMLWCDVCRSAIHVVHPSMATQQTPWFPVPPGA